jgi:hypothetical protein
MPACLEHTRRSFKLSSCPFLCVIPWLVAFAAGVFFARTVQCAALRVSHSACPVERRIASRFKAGPECLSIC